MPDVHNSKKGVGLSWTMSPLKGVHPCRLHGGDKLEHDIVTSINFAGAPLQYSAVIGHHLRKALRAPAHKHEPWRRVERLSTLASSKQQGCKGQQVVDVAVVGGLQVREQLPDNEHARTEAQPPNDSVKVLAVLLLGSALRRPAEFENWC